MANIHRHDLRHPPKRHHLQSPIHHRSQQVICQSPHPTKDKRLLIQTKTMVENGKMKQNELKTI
ncbi:hypothetical protein HanRHA438_Chr04g0176991 [Helianthus annuus]|nr:hypothetical protein HanIR_Chr04g0180431 [Helianthus annuus]KAJ0926931.1 hypothetical protein HanRHA438_Chr04g0176991 [Helianthus annuus]